MLQKLFTSTLLTLIAIGGFFVSFDGDKTYQINDKVGLIKSVEAASELRISAAGSDELKKADGRFSPVPSEQSNEVKEMYNKLVAGINIALGIVTVIVSPAIMLAGWLMSPDWTSGDLFGLREVMYKLWITVSNITYFIYAILLIFIALATIFGQENYGYKAMLPKLALGIILVPFTWWFVQWTISLASIVTASVISIPHEALSEIENQSAGSKKSWWTKPVIPNKIEINETSNIAKVTQTDCTAVNCKSPKEMLSSSAGMYGHMLVYAYGVFKLGEVKEINNATDAVKSVVKLIHDGLISIIMLLVFGLLTLALIFMLLARAVMLWVYTIFSPFMTLELVMGGIMKKVSDDFSIKEFVGLAFVPALVGLALSFGLVMVSAVQSGGTGGSKPICTDIKAGCTIASIMGNPENKITRKIETEGDKRTTINEVIIGGITFTFKGKIGGAKSDTEELESVNAVGSVINSAGGIFGTIVVDIIALLFIWMAFMAAKGVSKVVDAAAKPFQDMGESIGKLGASLPKYTPIPGLGVSASGLKTLSNEVSNKIESSGKEKAYDNPLAQALGVDKTSQAVVKDQTRLKQALDSKDKVSDGTLRQLQENTRNIVAAFGLSSSQGKQALQDLAQIMKNSQKTIDEKNLYDESGRIKRDGLRILEGDFNMTTGKDPTNDEIEKWKYKQKNYSGGSATNGTQSTIGGAVENKINNNFKMNIFGTDIQFSNSGDTLDKFQNIEALKDLKGSIKEEDFKKKVVGELGQKKGEALISEIKSKAPEFFKK